MNPYKYLLLLSFVLFNLVAVAEEEDEKNPTPRYTMFTLEGAHFYNSINEKHAIQAKFYMWSNLESNFGFETFLYFPTKSSNHFEFQVDLNYRKILVDFHPLFFDVLIGPGVRNYYNETDAKRAWIFDGVNIGFGIGYRYKRFSYYAMPRITHTNSQLQLTTGVKYHFNPEGRFTFKKRYKLKTKKVK